MTARSIFLSAFLFLLAGCSVDTPTAPTHTEAFSVERDKSEFLRVGINMNAGELQLSGGAENFAEGQARCNVEQCKPVIKYSSAAGRGNLSLEQPSPTTVNAKNRWDVRLANDVPLDLTVELGAGEAELNAGKLSLRRLEVRVGAGELRMDLRGDPQSDYDVEVRGGVGEAVIRLPKDVGISARATGALGSINVSGLRKEGDNWINDAYRNTGRKIRLDIQGGIGEIRLVAE